MTPAQIKAHFEANMLDGNDIDDCGGATISAKEVLEYLIETFAERPVSIDVPADHPMALAINSLFGFLGDEEEGPPTGFGRSLRESGYRPGSEQSEGPADEVDALKVMHFEVTENYRSSANNALLARKGEYASCEAIMWDDSDFVSVKRTGKLRYRELPKRILRPLSDEAADEKINGEWRVGKEQHEN